MTFNLLAVREPTRGFFILLMTIEKGSQIIISSDRAHKLTEFKIELNQASGGCCGHRYTDIDLKFKFLRKKYKRFKINLKSINLSQEV